ncbi:unnamed protein product [Rodentolepis nana]|uniref:EF-hand domain-containing protein n=1 Tax=Rodentolepis nana TaxID=102285 RepID=A0A0R3T6R7_RODNA|nr:unnamed protein product [Rodentolepis nana]
MDQRQRETIIQLVLGEMEGRDSPEAKLFRVKERIEKLFGKEWSLYQAYGGFWGICQFKAKSNLWFHYKGITYGVLQVPGSKDIVKSSILKIGTNLLKVLASTKNLKIRVNMSAPRQSSQEKFTPAFLLHLYDELCESKPDATLKDYEEYLMLWGMEKKKAKVCCSRINPNKKGRLTREDVCNGLGFAPEQPAGLRDIEILCRDMPIRKSESIQVIVLNVLNSKHTYVDTVTEIKRQVESIYGPQWNVFVASGRYWGLCTHKAGGNLVFAYNGVVYGIYQSPERDFEDSPFGINSSYAVLSSDMGDSLQPEKLVHLFDELTETQPGVPTSEYKKYLVKWGVDGKTATKICNMADPKGKGRITRDALCEGLKHWPNQPAILKNVQLLDSDMSVMKRESVTLLILEVIAERKSKKETIDEIKKRLQTLYGDGWSVYIAEGRYWSVCSHRPGSNLAFYYQNAVYALDSHMTSKYDAEKYILYFDELQEKNPSIPVDLYRDKLIKWGTPANEVAAIINMVDPERKKYITRNDIYNGINFDATRPHALKDVSYLTCQMPTMQRDSVALFVLELVAKHKEKPEMLRELKSRLEKVYGGDWTCFISEGRYWARHAHKPGTCLVFIYNGCVYGVHDSPSP